MLPLTVLGASRIDARALESGGRFFLRIGGDRCLGDLTGFGIANMLSTTRITSRLRDEWAGS